MLEASRAILNVADEIPVSFLRIELDGEASNVTDGVGASSRPRDGRKSKKHWRLPRGVREDSGFRQLRDGGVKLEGAVGSSASSMHC